MSESRSRRAGNLIRGQADPEQDGRSYVEARTRFVDAALGVARRRVTERPRRLIALAAAVALVMGVLVFIHVRDSRQPLTFESGPARVPGTIAEYMVPPVGGDLAVYFSDGSVVTLESTARARVDRTTPHGASVLVESGGISANIVHRTESEWAFVAGPYSVRVTGTSFGLSWNPSGVLEIWMKSGSVEVRGPGATPLVKVNGHRRFMSGALGTASAAGSASTADEGENPRASGVAGAPRSVDQTGGAPSSPRMLDIPATEATENGRALADEPSTRTERWSALVARGEYGQVLDGADRIGVENVLSTADVDQLAALADAARFTRRGSLAERALGQLRTRFPASGSAKAAAFLLGRMADDAGNKSVAVSWYESYLREAPGGPLASEALGRRMLALRSLKNVESTRSAAKEYLERFADGSYAPIAREIVGR